MGFLLGFVSFVVVAVIAALYIRKRITWKGEGKHKQIENWPVGATVIAVVALITTQVLVSAVQIIPAGHRGVVFSQASGVQKRILQEGFNLVVPVLESVFVMDVRIDRATATGAAASKDVQAVAIEVVTNYRFDPAKVNRIYQTIGDKAAVDSKILAPAVQEEVKSVTPRFTAVEIIEKRGEVKQLVFQGLRRRLAKYDVILTDVTLSDITFDPAFTAAIEDKTRQEQIALREEAIIRQNTAKANQAIETAKGQKESAILAAEGVAQANKLIAASVTDKTLEQRRLELTRDLIEKWNGVYPTTMLGEGTSTLLQLPPAN